MNIFKTFAAIALLSFLPATISAQTADDAVEFLSAHWTKHDSRLKKPAIFQAATVSEISIGGAKCFNIASSGNRGFVLYSQNNVIGYSTVSSLDIDDLPENFARTLEAIVSGSRLTADRTERVIPAKAVAPMLRTAWGQQAPFNGKCPTYKGSPAVTGCTGVALAQILFYHKPDNPNPYVMEYADPKSGAEISVDYSKARYDWSLVRESYDEGNYTQAEADEVGRLVYEAGVACKCEYSDATTSGQWPLVALERFYNFKTRPLMRKWLPTEYWMRSLYRELEEGRPVLYSGTDQGVVSNNQFKSHIFVVDGNDEDGLVHINWGWNSVADGYYDISIANPSEEWEGDGYQYNQLMICGIEPRTPADAPYHEGYVCVSGSFLNGESFETSSRGLSCIYGITSNSYSIENSREEGKQHIEIGAALVDEDGAIAGYSIDVPLYAQDYRFPGFNQLHVGVPTTGKISRAGKYYYKLAYRVSGSDEIYLLDLPMTPWVEVDSDGITTATGFDEYSGTLNFSPDMVRAGVTAFSLLTPAYAKTPFYAVVKSHSHSDFPAESNAVAYQHSCTFSFTDVVTGKVYLSESQKIYTRAYNGLDDTVILKFSEITNPDNNFKIPAGRYKIGSNTSGVTVSDNLFIDILETPAYPMPGYTVASYSDRFIMEQSLSQDEHMHLILYESDVRLRPVNGVYGNSTVNVYLCPEEDTSRESEILVSTMDINLFPTNTGSSWSSVEIPGLLYPLEGSYIAYMKYLTPDGEHQIFPYSWSKIDTQYGLSGSPKHIFINRATGEMPELEISSLHAADVARSTSDRISFSAKNNSTKTFSGRIAVKVCLLQEGRIEEAVIENVEIAPGGSTTLSVPVATDLAKIYDIYVKCMDSSMTDYAFALKADGSPAHFRLTNGTGGTAEGEIATQIKVEINDGHISLCGIDETAETTLISVSGAAVYRGRPSGIPVPAAHGVYILKVNSDNPQTLKIVL